MNPVIVQTIGYLVVFILSIFVMNFISSGFLIKFIRAKGSRGKLILVESDGINNMAWCLGKIDGNQLKFKNPAGKKKTILVDRNDFYRRFGVNCITIDDETNAVRKADYTVAESFDAEAYDDLLTRALTKPQLNNNKEIIIIIAIVIILLICVYNAYSITQLKPLIMNIKPAVVGGVIN